MGKDACASGLINVSDIHFVGSAADELSAARNDPQEATTAAFAAAGLAAWQRCQFGYE